MSYVFRGSVKMQVVATDGRAEGAEQVLREAQSARVDFSGEPRRIVVLSAAKPIPFVRNLPQRTMKVLDLVDVVAGGDGFAGRRGRGIDPTSGQPVESCLFPDPQIPSRSDGKYHRVAANPLVDGVFVPDGTKDEVQVDSAGHVFSGFRGTVGQTWHPVWAGGPIRGTDRQYPTAIDNVDYASANHGLVFLHASNAVTFDLEAIRRANPNCEPLRFRATAANTSLGDHDVLADVWVLVDGEPRFRRRQFGREEGVFSVSVPIGRTSRYLTLAATDGGDGVSHDWIIFGDPRLELSPVRAEQ